MEQYRQVIRTQKWITLLGVGLLVIKFGAWYITGSVAILTDALESIVNITAGAITLGSLLVAAKPRDTSHPYGHGKAEFISAGIEGTLIVVAGLVIFYEAAIHLIRPSQITDLDYGLLLVALSGLANLIAGLWAIRIGRRNKSVAISATGKHLVSDSISSAGLLLGLAIIFFTGWQWMDSIIAFIFGAIITITGLKIIRGSIAGIMDEADEALLSRLVNLLNENRRQNWIDLHNLRVIKYGNRLHIDCHLTLPWYLNLNEANEEVENLEKLIKENYGNLIEFFVHMDGCSPFSCRICDKEPCPERKYPFTGKVTWTNNNLFENRNHEFTN